MMFVFFFFFFSFSLKFDIIFELIIFILFFPIKKPNNYELKKGLLMRQMIYIGGFLLMNIVEIVKGIRIAFNGSILQQIIKERIKSQIKINTK